MVKLLNNKKAFSLVEIIIYIAILSFSSLVFMSFMINITKVRNKVYAAQEVQANLRLSINKIKSLIHQAESLDTLHSVFNINPGKLVLNMSNQSLNPTIIELDNNNLLKVTQGNLNSIERIVSDEVKVDKLIFKNFSVNDYDENVQIILGISYNGKENDIVFNYKGFVTTTVNLRLNN